MHHAANAHPKHWSPDTLPAADQARVRQIAATLRQAERLGRPARPLHGKTFAVLCDADDCERAAAVKTWAEALGANVARIRPAAHEHTPPEKIDEMARLLGRLYDGIDCHQLPAIWIEHLEKNVGKPVFRDCCCTDANCAVPSGDARLTHQALLVMALRGAP